MRRAGREQESVVEQALITMQRTAHDSDGVAIEFGDYVYRADGYTIQVTVFDR